MSKTTVKPIVSAKINIRGSQEFGANLKRVCLATEPESMRYSLGSVLVVGDGEMLRFTATNGRRLHLFDTPLASDLFSILVDGKALAKIATAIKAQKMFAELIIEPTGVTAMTGKKTSYAGIDRSGLRYPDYRGCFASTEDWIEVPAARLVALARAFGKNTDEEKGCDINITGSCLAFGERSTGLAFLPYVSRREEPIKECVITLDTSYLVDALDGLPDGQTVRVNYNDHKTAVHFVADAFQAVIMPLTRDR